MCCTFGEAFRSFLSPYTALASAGPCFRRGAKRCACTIVTCANKCCRRHKHDGQLVKKLKELMWSTNEYFKWAFTEAPLEPDFAASILQAFLGFVDHLACYFAPIGIPQKLVNMIIKVAKGFTADQRCNAAKARRWQAERLSSAALWQNMRPALKQMLESPSADTENAKTQDASDLEGSDAPKRPRRELARAH